MTAVAQGLRPRWVRALAVVLAAGLSACTALNPPPQPVSTTMPHPETARGAPSITTVPPEPPRSATVRRAPAGQPADSEAATAGPVDPERLLGLDSSDLHRQLGTPETVEIEGPAEVWQYAVGDCVLRLFLYADIGTGARRTLRYDAHPIADSSADCSPPLPRTAANGKG